MKSADYPILLLSNLDQLSDRISVTKTDVLELFRLFSTFFEQLTESESIGFTTLFTRIAFVGIKNNYPAPLLYDNHYFRRKVEQGEFGNPEFLMNLGIYLLKQNLLQIYSDIKIEKNPRPIFLEEEKKVKQDFFRVIRAIIVEEIKEDGKIVFLEESSAHLKKTAIINNLDLRQQLSAAVKHIGIPLSVNFIDVKMDISDQFIPSGIVILPDFLVGVTSVSECFQSGGKYAGAHLSRKLVPTEASTPILIGNIVNYFFDELIHQPDLDYNTLIKETFRLAPLQFSCMSDEELLACVSKIKHHFNNLRNVVRNELADTGITKEKAYLEPSFYSNEYGLYGRLDLYHFNESNRQSDIVELKSGKLFRSNSYGLNENHYIQTLLYDLIIESVYKGRVKSNNYILYSYLDSQRLKYAPKVRSKQYMAIILRNDIVILEHLLARVDEDKYAFLLDRMNPDDIPTEFTFVKRDSRQYFNAYRGLDSLEKIYIRTFLAFISREYILSKTGEHGIHKLNGMASLWLDPVEEKIEKFSILNGLELTKNKSHSDIPFLELSYSQSSAPLSKFRKGDVCVLYPGVAKSSEVLKHQIFKCTILTIDDKHVKVRLRARQKNHDVFRKYRYWNLESDVLDSSFNQLYYALYDFMISPPEYRKSIFGLIPPQSSKQEFKLKYENLSSEQDELLKRGIEAKDYFLLWGPPGTGKTSVMIRSYVDYYFNNSDENILLLAYTNRAVDEICETILKVVGDNFIRIGSRYSTGDKYVNSLLRVRTEQINNRRDLVQLIKGTRIFVSTISSIQGKRELFKLKKFDLAIVDEASQLLEPMLIGLLGRFRKFIMIGDHKQLPAVVTQKESESKVKSELLQNQIGMTDCRTSLFERMYKNCEKKEWTNAYGVLSKQGRMHENIQNFVSPVFYQGLLSPLNKVKRLTSESFFKSHNKLRKMLIAERMLFVNVPVDSSLTSKTNELEASVVAGLVNEWKEIYKENGSNIEASSIGVITPFRAQIAMIRSLLKEEKNITVDTVERYQGGARNQIIFSLSISRADMLDSISNYSDEGIDRKLNVALTRAKDHLIILGAVDILKRNSVYQELIEYCKLIDYTEII